MEEERHEQALLLFKEAAELAPSNGTYHRFVGWVLCHKLSRHAEALPHLRKARAMIPGDVEVHLDFAFTAGNLRLYDEMFPAYDAALDLYREEGKLPPEWIFSAGASSALFNLSPPDIELGKKYLDLAHEFDQPAEITDKIHSWISSAYQNLGWAANKVGERDKAMEVFSEAYAHDPDNADNIHGYGHILQETQQLEESQEVLRRGRRLHPGHEGIRDSYICTLQALAWEHDRNGETDGALGLFRDALELDPHNQWSVNGYGALLNKTGDFRLAAGLLEQGYRLFPDNEYIPLNLLNAYRALTDRLWKSGEESEADALFEKALAIRPDDFWTNLDMFYKHLLAEKEDSKPLAEEVLRLIDGELVTEQAESVGAFYASYGHYLFSRQEVDYAREILNRGLSALPNDAVLYSTLGFTYFRIDMDRWREMLEQTLKMVPRFEQIALGTYQFPLKNDRIKVSQGNHGGISHLGLANGYAWDFVVVDEAEEFCTGWEKKENHYIYGEAVYAAADGEVERVHDSDPDTEPGQNDPRYSGNDISIRHENGELSMYVHLLQGSSIVKVGDRVHRGQQIASVGCSGRYVDFPHLHFQVNRGNHSVETKLVGTKLLQDGRWTDPGAYVPRGEDILQTEW